jgi:hypothetical protein
VRFLGFLKDENPQPDDQLFNCEKAGCYSAWLRIATRNGTLRFDGNQYGCDSVVFIVANGDTRRIPVDTGSRRQTVLVMNHRDGVAGH